MVFAKVAPDATRKPRVTKKAGSVTPNIRAEFEAMKRFEGLAKGMRLNPKELIKTNSSSMNDAIPRFPRISVKEWERIYKGAIAAKSEAVGGESCVL